MLLDVLLFTEVAVEQILLECPSAALLSKQSLGLTVVLFKLGRGGKYVQTNLILKLPLLLLLILIILIINKPITDEIFTSINSKM